MSRQWRSLWERLGLQPLGPRHQTSSANLESLPLYSAVTASESCSPTVANLHSELGNDNVNGCTSYAIRTAALDRSLSQPWFSPLWCLFRPPTLARFLADFTLGFADGLTVPFALTAGLSSLGHTDTVIYAGMAEICAGSISMGVGGYLSARGEVAAAEAAKVAESHEADDDAVVQEEKASSDDAIARYLDPLDLPFQLREMVIGHILGCPAAMDSLLQTQLGSGRLKSEEEDADGRLPSPLIAGTSVALGYLVGGVLPLFPYFFVSQVKDGMMWSFGVCAAALFVFGFGRDFALSGKPRSAAAVAKAGVKVPWTDIRRSAWEGAQMVILGSVAAVAAILCVRAFESIK